MFLLTFWKRMRNISNETNGRIETCLIILYTNRCMHIWK